MNAFYEHHEHSIRASYRCFDRKRQSNCIWTVAAFGREDEA
jgi:hypothetical protein